MASKSNPRRQTRRGRRSTIDHNARIKVLAKENPKRPGTGAAKRFAKYADGITVKTFLRKGGKIEDVRWDRKQKFIALQAPTARSGGAQRTSA